MKRLPAWVVFVAVACGLAGCSEGMGPSADSLAARKAGATASLPTVRFSEIHYDNAGTDVGEAIEISGPAGADVTGWTVVLYNGNGGGSYNTSTLSGTIPATCGTRGVVVIDYPTNGIQNGDPNGNGDGMALVDAAGALVEFLSYEGSFTATNGPAMGATSVDIGVAEIGNEPPGLSLQRIAGAWAPPSASSFGACNDGVEPPPPPVVARVLVTPATATLAQGATRTFVATAFDGANQPVAGVSFTWTSSAPGVATVGGSGLASGVTPGDAELTATAPNGVAGTASLHVTVAPPLPEIRFSELHYDNIGTDVGEAIEVEGPAGSDLTGWTVVLYDGNDGTPYSTQSLSGVIPATCAPRGVVVLDYPSNGIQNGSPDGMALVNGAGQLVEFLSYEGTFTAVGGPADGVLSVDILAAESSSPVGVSLQRDAFDRWQLSPSTFGFCNPSGPPPPGNTISFSGRTTADPALPVGFQDQVFATVRDANNQAVTTTISWSSETPAVASIDQDGVITALAEGTLSVRATAADGTTATYSLPTRIAVASTTALYVGNAEFGEPVDSDPTDDFIVRHPEYTASYNPLRGTPNWVSYDLDPSDFGPEDRCNCFTFDPDLPASFTHFTTAEYTGAGALAGFGIDRGHLARSFDRTSASLDNARTFLFSNVVPQASDLNQGPWAQLESDLGDLVRTGGKEVYVIAGVAGNKGTLKNEGKVVIPASIWKVAVIMAHDHGLADVVDYRDLEVIAVNMPNDPGIRNVPWQTYQTTVDAIEALSGYDLLALLPDKVETIVEAGIKPPIAVVDGPYQTTEGGAAVTMSAAASVDPNGTVVGFAWTFGDGATGTGPVVSHGYAQRGTYTVSVVVTDNDGLTDTVFTTVAVANVAPTVAPFAGASLLPGETYSSSGSFTDPGAGPWTATVNYGDGTGPVPLALSGKTFALGHVYPAHGTFTVTVQVSDGLASGTAGQTVTVLSSVQAVQQAIGLVQQLASAGKLRRGVALLLGLELGNAARELAAGRPVRALVSLGAVAVELDLLVRFGDLSAADAGPLRSLIARIIRAVLTQSGG